MISEGLRTAIDAQKITLETLSSQSGVPLETIRNLFYHKAENPRLKTVISLCQALNISVESLISDMYLPIIMEDEKILLEYYRQCSSHGKQLICLIASIESEMLSVCTNTEYRHTVPCFIPTSTSACGSPYTTCDVRYIDVSTPEAFAAIQIPNNLHAPEYFCGDTILLSNRFPDYGEHAFFFYEGNIYLRRFVTISDSEWILSDIHGRTSDIHLDNLHSYRLIGTCIGIMRENI